MDTEKGRRIGDELLAARSAKRRAEAEELRLVTQLAVAYHLDAEDEALHDALYEQDLPVGGPGCPLVSEWLAPELAALLGCTTRQATTTISRALNLRYRHPALWTAVQQLEVDAPRAAAAAARCARLPLAIADVVSGPWLKLQHRYSWTGAMNLMDRLVAETAPLLAEKRERDALDARYVSISRYEQATMQISGQLDVLDARYLDAAIEQIADILNRDGSIDTTGFGKDRLRAKALGILAHPAYALALQQQSAQPTLPDGERPTGHASSSPAPVPSCAMPACLPLDPEDPDAEYHRPHPSGSAGHTCGTITVPVARLRPTAQLFVHIPADSVAGLPGAARVERAGQLTQATLARLLHDKHVTLTVRPVIDLPELPAEDHYRPSGRMREAITQIFVTEAFPYSTTPARGLQLDHTIAYQTAGPPGQTAAGNLAPLRARIHRLKTAGHWHAAQDSPGRVTWRTPLGYEYVVTPHGTYPLRPRRAPRVAKRRAPSPGEPSSGKTGARPHTVEAHS